MIHFPHLFETKLYYVLLNCIYTIIIYNNFLCLIMLTIHQDAVVGLYHFIFLFNLTFEL